MSENERVREQQNYYANKITLSVKQFEILFFLVWENIRNKFCDEGAVWAGAVDGN